MKENRNNKGGVYETIKEEILFMELLPGEAISEIEIAKRFSVSRTPVREAFKRLEYEGLLEIKSHSGTFVTLIDLKQINDIRFMREQLELAVIESVIETMDATLELRLKMILERQKQLFDKGLSDNELAKEFMKSDNEFHRTLFEFANRGGVWKYLMSIEHHYERLRMFLNIHDKEYLFSLHEDHVQFYEFIMNKDWDSIKSRYKTHLSQGIDRGSDMIVANSQYFKEF